jgi:hypothetical protein
MVIKKEKGPGVGRGFRRTRGVTNNKYALNAGKYRKRDGGETTQAYTIAYTMAVVSDMEKAQNLKGTGMGTGTSVQSMGSEST